MSTTYRERPWKESERSEWIESLEKRQADGWLTVCERRFLSLLKHKPSPIKLACQMGVFCSFHNFTHGAEAEELREKLEALIKEAQERDRNIGPWELERLLEEVDARDAVAFGEITKQHEKEDEEVARERGLLPSQRKGRAMKQIQVSELKRLSMLWKHHADQADTMAATSAKAEGRALGLRQAAADLDVIVELAEALP